MITSSGASRKGKRNVVNGYVFSRDGDEVRKALRPVLRGFSSPFQISRPASQWWDSPQQRVVRIMFCDTHVELAEALRDDVHDLRRNVDDIRVLYKLR